MNGKNDDARDAFGGVSSDASAAFGGPARKPLAAPAIPEAVRATVQLPMQAFSDLGQRQQPLTQTDTSIARAQPPEAIAAFVLSIFGVLLFPAAIAALFYANKAKAKVQDQPGRYAGGLATTARVIAFVGLAIAAARFIALLADN